jgi:hypothetical protein
MPMKQTGRKVYKSMQGKQIDMDLLRQKNELTPAVGNARVNARGDELGPGGKIIRTREQILADHQKDHPGVPDEVAVAKPKKSDMPQDPLVVEDEEWVEDDDGNFVQRGD